MDKFVTFLETIMVKEQNLNPIDKYCCDNFRIILMRLSPSLNNTVNLNNVCQELYQKFLTDKIQIGCLIFSDGNKIYEDIKILKRITFFDNYFSDNACDDVIIELQLSDVIDDYDAMKHVIKFIYDGGTKPEYFYGYTLMHKMVKINNYLLDVMSLVITKTNLNTYITLRELIIHSFNVLLRTLANKNLLYTYNDKLLDILYETYMLLGLKHKIHVWPNSTFHKNKNDILKTPLSAILVFPGQKIDI